MASTVRILQDESLLSFLDVTFLKFERILALLSGVIVFSLMLLAVISVTGRNIFGQPLLGYVDWIEQAMPLIAFMGISFVMREGGHIRMDIIIGLLKGRALYVVELITTFFILLLMLLLVWGTWAHFQRSFDFSAPLWSRDSSMDISLPLWPAKLLAPFAFSVISLRLILQLWGFGRAIITNTPIAVATIPDISEQAHREALQYGEKF